MTPRRIHNNGASQQAPKKTHLAAEDAGVLGVLRHLDLLDDLTERGTVPGPILPADPHLLRALALLSVVIVLVWVGRGWSEPLGWIDGVWPPPSSSTAVASLGSHSSRRPPSPSSKSGARTMVPGGVCCRRCVDRRERDRVVWCNSVMLDQPSVCMPSQGTCCPCHRPLAISRRASRTAALQAVNPPPASINSDAPTAQPHSPRPGASIDPGSGCLLPACCVRAAAARSRSPAAARAIRGHRPPRPPVG